VTAEATVSPTEVVMLVGLATIVKSSTVTLTVAECLRLLPFDSPDAVTVIVQVVIRVFSVVPTLKEAIPEVWVVVRSIGRYVGRLTVIPFFAVLGGDVTEADQLMLPVNPHTLVIVIPNNTVAPLVTIPLPVVAPKAKSGVH
jgi:hypothetical protein